MPVILEQVDEIVCDCPEEDECQQCGRVERLAHV